VVDVFASTAISQYNDTKEQTMEALRVLCVDQRVPFAEHEDGSFTICEMNISHNGEVYTVVTDVAEMQTHDICLTAQQVLHFIGCQRPMCMFL
jgi:hypothetical protein